MCDDVVGIILLYLLLHQGLRKTLVIDQPKNTLKPLGGREACPFQEMKGLGALKCYFQHFSSGVSSIKINLFQAYKQNDNFQI